MPRRGMRCLSQPELQLDECSIALTDRKSSGLQLCIHDKQHPRAPMHAICILFFVDGYSFDPQLGQSTLFTVVQDGKHSSYHADTRITDDGHGIRIDSNTEPDFYFEIPFVEVDGLTVLKNILTQ
jgi:hypothetical protein